MKSAVDLVKFIGIVMIYMVSSSAEVLVVKVMNYELHVRDAMQTLKCLARQSSLPPAAVHLLKQSFVAAGLTGDTYSVAAKCLLDSTIAHLFMHANSRQSSHEVN